MCIKNALKRVDLRRSSFNVTEQEVLERRKALVCHMLQARRDGKRAVLVRDKVLIDGRPFVPTFTLPLHKDADEKYEPRICSWNVNGLKKI
ncbi:hypothetical protein DPMN_136497 [Dreissena polymorpha]|uniref:Uncharacterized protein n=1 Tax=Dreissena polymorpha TaxID=45954 RepID=A0A9D4JCQ8_DREPO|nr:hypothetical protein DPMN_136497 [Dreissena polymorpha]